MTLGERLVVIRKAQIPKMNQTEFAGAIGMTRSAYSMYEIDKVVPTETVIKLICSTFGINYPWLKDGMGEMRCPPDTEDEMVDRIMTGEDSFAKSVMRAFAKLDDGEWELLKKIVDKIKEEER